MGTAHIENIFFRSFHSWLWCVSGLNSLREQNLFCDLTIVVGNLKIPCHKVVIAASSETFNAVLNKVTTKEIQLTKIDESAVQEMIKFIYTSQVAKYRFISIYTFKIL